MDITPLAYWDQAWAWLRWEKKEVVFKELAGDC